jgi:hypothetical protein
MTARKPSIRSGRRSFVKGVGLTALAAPFVVSPRKLFAQGGGGEQNLLLLTWNNGLEEGWEPTFPAVASPPSDFQLSERMSSLQPYRDDLAIVMGLRQGYLGDLGAHSEGPLSLWTGTNPDQTNDLANYPSIDYIVGEQIGALAPYRVMHFGVQARKGMPSSFGNGLLHFAGPQQAVEAEDDPSATYAQVFGGAVGEVDEATIARLRRERGSVLDFVTGRLNRLRGQVSASDRVKLDEHLENVRRVERSLDALGDAECNVPYDQPSLTGSAALEDANFEAVSHLQADLATIALQCGLTRVATIDLSNTDSQAQIPGVNPNYPVHAVMHERPTSEKYPINSFYIEQLAYVIGRLKSVELGEGRTLLDDTLVVAGSEMAIGNHRNSPMPFIVAGGGNGYFKLGRAVEIEGSQRHTRFLVTVLHAMGLTSINQLGDYTGDDAERPLTEVLG